jgi:hypothetical protein
MGTTITYRELRLASDAYRRKFGLNQQAAMIARYTDAGDSLLVSVPRRNWVALHAAFTDAMES